MQNNYSSTRRSLRTGDILLFSGKGRISRAIKHVTGSPWSHVGIVLNLTEYDFVCLWESTTLSNVADLDTGTLRSGVQVVPLSARLDAYDGSVALRRINGFIDPQGLALLNLRLMALRRELAGRPYERSRLELYKAAYDGPLGANEEDLSSLFCSELVAEAFQRLGIIDPSRPSNEYVPADFAAASENIPWRNCGLEDEFLIKG